MTNQKTKVTVEATVNAPVEKVWKIWTDAGHITKWNSPSDEWHTPKASHDVKDGGRFTFRMEARDGSAGFDLSGTYNVVKPNELLEYTLDDDRKVKVDFKSTGNTTHITQTFEAEDVHPVEFQQAGWQAILNNFKKYTEANH